MKSDVFKTIWFVIFVLYITWYFFIAGYTVSDFRMETVGKLFVALSIVSGIYFISSIYKKIIIDRIFLSVSLIIFLAALAYLGNISSILYYDVDHDDAKVIPYICIFLVGLFTTFFTDAGFVGVISSDKRAVKMASFQLLFISILGCIGAFFIPQSLYGLFTLFFACFIRGQYDGLGQKLRGEKVTAWLFKW